MIKWFIRDFFEDVSDTDTYNAWEEDLAILNIFFGQETVMGDPHQRLERLLVKYKFSAELERGIRMGPVEFFSSLGGIFGLCLGFSIISFIEVTFDFAYKVCVLFIYFMLFPGDLLGSDKNVQKL